MIDLPIVAGEPGSPYTVLGSVLVGFVGFVIVIRAIKIKIRRQAVSATHQHKVVA